MDSHWDERDGELLSERLKREPPPDSATVLRWLASLAETLAALHAAGDTAGDLSPARVRLVGADGLEVRLGPRDVSGATRTPYDALERYATVPRATPSSDLYALCAIAWCVLTGSPPAPANDRAIQDLQPSFGRLLAAGRWPAELVAALDAGLTVAPAARPASLAPLLAALRVAGAPVGAAAGAAFAATDGPAAATGSAVPVPPAPSFAPPSSVPDATTPAAVPSTPAPPAASAAEPVLSAVPGSTPDAPPTATTRAPRLHRLPPPLLLTLLAFACGLGSVVYLAILTKDLAFVLGSPGYQGVFTFPIVTFLLASRLLPADSPPVGLGRRLRTALVFYVLVSILATVPLALVEAIEFGAQHPHLLSLHAFKAMGLTFHIQMQYIYVSMLAMTSIGFGAFLLLTVLSFTGFSSRWPAVDRLRRPMPRWMHWLPVAAGLVLLGCLVNVYLDKHQSFRDKRIGAELRRAGLLLTTKNDADLARAITALRRDTKLPEQGADAELWAHARALKTRWRYTVDTNGGADFRTIGDATRHLDEVLSENVETLESQGLGVESSAIEIAVVGAGLYTEFVQLHGPVLLKGASKAGPVQIRSPEPGITVALGGDMPYRRARPALMDLTVIGNSGGPTIRLDDPAGTAEITRLKVQSDGSQCALEIAASVEPAAASSASAASGASAASKPPATTTTTAARPAPRLASARHRTLVTRSVFAGGCGVSVSGDATVLVADSQFLDMGGYPLIAADRSDVLAQRVEIRNAAQLAAWSRNEALLTLEGSKLSSANERFGLVTLENSAQLDLRDTQLAASGLCLLLAKGETHARVERSQFHRCGNPRAYAISVGSGSSLSLSDSGFGGPGGAQDVAQYVSVQDGAISQFKGLTFGQ